MSDNVGAKGAGWPEGDFDADAIIQVRLDGPTEQAVRHAAKEMGVQVNRVKKREDCVQLYGSKAITLPSEEIA